MKHWVSAILACLVGAGSCASAPRSESDAQIVRRVADQMVALELRRNPLLGYTVDLGESDHRRWPDRSAEAIAGYERDSDALLSLLSVLDPTQLDDSERAFYAMMRERLEANQQLRVCRGEWWSVNHMGGWHLALTRVAREQPVATEQERAWALERWSALSAMVDQEIANARAGLDHGYSAPKSVVRRVIQQVSGLIAQDAQASPLNGPAARSPDPAFAAEFSALIAGPGMAALRRYHDFLEREYLPRAREALAVSANPNGRECYRASLRSYTTLQRTPEEVFALGQHTVAANGERVRELGRATFGTDDLAEIAARIPAAHDNRFASEEELIAYSRDMAARSRELSRTLFLSLPAQEMAVEPFEAFRRDAGGSSYYEPQPDPGRPATYRIASANWELETRGGAEITAVHEGYPGHHMQIASAAASGQSAPITRLLINSAYVEGWARYAEALAEEAGMYRSPYALITRRLWPARGMVIDPGQHAMGWSREQAIAFMRESGRFRGEDAEALVDRIAILPGQLTAYDTGGLEIMALRREAEQALGEGFDLRAFHEQVLRHGPVPLAALRQNIEAWIEQERR